MCSLPGPFRPLCRYVQRLGLHLRGSCYPCPHLYCCSGLQAVPMCWLTAAYVLICLPMQRKLETLKPAMLNILNESHKHAGHAGELACSRLAGGKQRRACCCCGHDMHGRAWAARRQGLKLLQLCLSACCALCGSSHMMLLGCMLTRAGNPGGGPDAETHFRYARSADGLVKCDGLCRLRVAPTAAALHCQPAVPSSNGSGCVSAGSCQGMR